MTIRHVVAWRIAAEDDATKSAHAREVAERLNALQGVVPEIISIRAGAEAAYPGKNWDVAVVADFADVAALERYQTHPAHVEAGAFIKSVVADRVAVDFEV